MKLTLNTKKLSAALNKAQSVVEPRNTIPILANVLLEVTDGALSITGTDLDSSLCVTINDVEITTNGATTVSAKTFSDIVKRLPDGDCTIEANETEMVVKSGRSRFKLAVLPAADFPSHAQRDYSGTFELSGDELKSAFDSVAFSMSQEETRYYLNGTYMHSHNGCLRLVSTDGHRLSCIDTIPYQVSVEAGIIIPRKAVLEAGRHFADAPEVFVSYSDAYITFTADGIVFTSKLVDATYPEYKRVIPTSNDVKMRVNAAALKSMIERVSVVLGGDSRGIKLLWKDNTVSAEVTHDLNAANDLVDADTGGAEISIGANYRYLIDALSRFEGEVEFSFSDSGTPMLICDPKNADYLTLLMPMRI